MEKHESNAMNVTIITGTTQGIGSSLVEALAPRSDRLITINRRSTEHPDEVLCDLSSAEEVKRAAGELTLKLAKGNEVLFVMNAGQLGNAKTVSDVTPETLGALMYTNVYSQLTLVESLIQAEHRVRVVGITSALGSISRPTLANYDYAGSKAAFNKSLSQMHKQYPAMDYMLVHPGWVQTQIGGEDAHLTPDQSAQYIVAALDDPANWNRADGMLKPSTGEIVPW